MSKLILSLDGGGVRGAATTQFLTQVERELKRYNKSLRDEVDFFAGTSAGGTIALALATTDKSLAEIDELHGDTTASILFTKNGGFFSRLLPGILTPRYKRSGKLEVLNQILGDATLGNVADNKEALVVTYDVQSRTPIVIKSTDAQHRELLCTQIVDATSAAPTYFPTADLHIKGQDTWSIDGGVVANNPTMCAIAEARKHFRTPLDQMRVISVGTGHRTQPVNGRASQRWGAIQWAVKGQILDILSDERIVAYQAQTITRPGSYIRVDSELSPQPGMPSPPEQALDDVDPDNIRRIRDMGKFWFDRYGEQVVSLILNQYQGPSLGRIDVQTGLPLVIAE
ncbi:patatin-like phospholipase family protein [Bacterioplanoides sp.]|uniref:patatin-like phospholipase family protein n=1 Tax=Bacterioplanoides sp. TaxID=2066072 RepID=UPI003B00778C